MSVICSWPKLLCHHSSVGPDIIIAAIKNHVIFGTELFVVYNKIKRKKSDEYKIRWGGIKIDSRPISTCQNPSKLMAATASKLVMVKAIVFRDSFTTNGFIENKSPILFIYYQFVNVEHNFILMLFVMQMPFHAQEIAKEISGCIL